MGKSLALKPLGLGRAWWDTPTLKLPAKMGSSNGNRQWLPTTYDNDQWWGQ